MELEQHIERLIPLHDEMEGLLSRSAQHWNDHPYTAPLRPQGIRLNVELAGTLAKASFELIRLVPHALEINHIRKEVAQYEQERAE